MNLTIALFGITREIVGQSALTVSVPADTSVQGLLEHLRRDYPELGRLSSLAVAVNNEYAQEATSLRPNDEIALIPPVSGG